VLLRVAHLRSVSPPPPPFTPTVAVGVKQVERLPQLLQLLRVQLLCGVSRGAVRMAGASVRAREERQRAHAPAPAAEPPTDGATRLGR
jgi:hypothetical protein